MGVLFPWELFPIFRLICFWSLFSAQPLWMIISPPVLKYLSKKKLKWNDVFICWCFLIPHVTYCSFFLKQAPVTQVRAWPTSSGPCPRTSWTGIVQVSFWDIIVISGDSGPGFLVGFGHLYSYLSIGLLVQPLQLSPKQCYLKCRNNERGKKHNTY